jgi:hypothetical protein
LEVPPRIHMTGAEFTRFSPSGGGDGPQG